MESTHEQNSKHRFVILNIQWHETIDVIIQEIDTIPYRTTTVSLYHGGRRDYQQNLRLLVRLTTLSQERTVRPTPDTLAAFFSS